MVAEREDQHVLGSAEDVDDAICGRVGTYAVPVLGRLLRAVLGLPRGDQEPTKSLLPTALRLRDWTADIAAVRQRYSFPPGDGVHIQDDLWGEQRRSSDEALLE